MWFGLVVYQNKQWSMEGNTWTMHPQKRKALLPTQQPYTVPVNRQSELSSPSPWGGGALNKVYLILLLLNAWFLCLNSQLLLNLLSNFTVLLFTKKQRRKKQHE